MDDQTPGQLAEIIDAINLTTVLKALEIYRDDEIRPQDARIIDRHLNDLARRILVAIRDQADQPEQQGAVLLTTEQGAPSSAPAAAAEPSGPSICGDAEGSQNAPGTMSNHPAVGCSGPELPLPDLSPGENGDDPLEKKKQPTLAKRSKKAKNIGKKPERHQIAEDIERWKAENKTSNLELERLAGLSHSYVSKICRGLIRQLTTKTINKINKVIKPKKKPVTKAPPPAPPKTNGSGNSSTTVAAPKSPSTPKNNYGQFVQKSFMAWMYREKLDIKGAAEKLLIKEGEVRSIQVGNLPSKSTLTVLGRHIPDIQNNLHELKAAAEKGAA